MHLIMKKQENINQKVLKSVQVAINENHWPFWKEILTLFQNTAVITLGAAACSSILAQRSQTKHPNIVNKD